MCGESEGENASDLGQDRVVFEISEQTLSPCPHHCSLKLLLDLELPKQQLC